MKKLLLLLVFLPLYIWGSEGMWLPCCLSKQTQQVMKEMGLELSSEQLYNPGGKALANAVVSFGGFCSGVVVSPDGLVFTNHHCGYDAIQQHSSVEHDYLRDGFVADSLSKELPNPDLFVSFLIRTEDVTERVLQAIPVGTKENDRALIVDSISTLIAQEAVANDTLLRAEITPFYGGNEFYLSVYKDYYDVRLVFAPPSSVGKFGGIQIIGYGPAIPGISLSSVFMLIRIINRQLILRRMCLIIRIILLLFLWEGMNRDHFA